MYGRGDHDNWNREDLDKIEKQPRKGIWGIIDKFTGFFGIGDI